MRTWERAKMGKRKWIIGTGGGREVGKEGGEDLFGNILWSGGSPKRGATAQGMRTAVGWGRREEISALE